MIYDSPLFEFRVKCFFLFNLICCFYMTNLKYHFEIFEIANSSELRQLSQDPNLQFSSHFPDSKVDIRQKIRASLDEFLFQIISLQTQEDVSK